MNPPLSHHWPAFRWWLPAAVALAGLLGPGRPQAAAAGFVEGFEGPATRATLAPAAGLRLISQQIEQGQSHSGAAAETLVLEAAQPALARLLLPLAEAAVIDEFKARLWVRCDHPGVRLACRVRLPQARTAAGVPLELFVAGPPNLLAIAMLRPISIEAGIELPIALPTF